jgi:hypothetical protein
MNTMNLTFSWKKAHLFGARKLQTIFLIVSTASLYSIDMFFLCFGEDDQVV